MRLACMEKPGVNLILPRFGRRDISRTSRADSLPALNASVHRGSSSIPSVSIPRV